MTGWETETRTLVTGAKIGVRVCRNCNHAGPCHKTYAGGWRCDWHNPEKDPAWCDCRDYRPVPKN